MAFNAAKRKKVENFIINNIKKIDPNENVKFYKDFFSSLSDKKFDEFMIALKNNETQLFIQLPNLKKSITNEKILEIADDIGVDSFKKIRFKDNSTKRKFLTPFKFLILEIPIRRVIQYLFHKISIPESDKKTDVMTGQVIKPDKGAKLSLIETQILLNKGLKKSIIELLKYRGGDVNSYQEFKNKIDTNGSIKLDEIESESLPRSEIIVDILFKCIHIGSNLINDKEVRNG